MSRNSTFWRLRALSSVRRELARLAQSRALSRVPLARWSRYSIMPKMSLGAYARRTAGVTVEHIGHLEGPTRLLPHNIDHLEALPSLQERWMRSFQDVPKRSRQPPSVVSLYDVTILTATDAWGLEHFSLLGTGSVRIIFGGTRWFVGHRQLLRDNLPSEEVEQAAWPWESWTPNYYHWMLRHVPKFIMLKERGLLDIIVLPPRLQLSEVQLDSLRALGVDISGARRLEEDVVAFGHLTIVDIPDTHSSTVRALRSGLEHLTGVERYRRLYVRRATPGRRQLANDDEVWAMLSQSGFEEVSFEAIPFA